MGWMDSEFKGVKNGVEANVLTFVPNGDKCEVSQIKITNTTSDVRRKEIP